tara:strand:+ start:118 stop:327 length:210 start_codon:yes stop_codon:yes gene_type:complete
MEKITKDTLIGDVMEKAPEAGKIMMEYGLHCFGCGGASLESIEMGAKAHGMDDEKIAELVEKINATIKE